MPDVWLGRFSRWIEKTVNAKGGPVIFDVSPSLQTVISTQAGVEDLFSQSVNRYAGFLAQGAVAAQQSFVQLRNPVASGVVITTELVACANNVATVSTYHLDQTQASSDFSNPTSGNPIDSRNKGHSVAIMSQGTAASADTGVIQLIDAGSSTPVHTFFSIPITLLPGDMLRVVDTTLNEAVTVEFVWRERVLESSELT